jgi:hypothetical protein
MALFIIDDATGIGSDDLSASQVLIDLAIIVDDDGLGLDDPVGGRQRVTYVPTTAGGPQTRVNALVNTAFSPDYGGGAQNVDTLVIGGLSGFVLDDGTSLANNGTALPPASSGLAGANLNPTENCLVIYDTQATICVARDGTNGDLDLPISTPVILFHEFSHAFRIVNNVLLELSAGCDPSSPEERAAIIDENDLRTQIANRQGEAPELRDPGIHCGRVDSDCSSCCIIATLASGSLTSPEVQSLRSVRDRFVRSTEAGHAFFEAFFRDYYSFSPQVCTILAGDPRLPGYVLKGFVEPLLAFWSVMIERSDQRWDDAELGSAFSRSVPDRATAKARLAAIQRTAMYWFGPVDEAPAELLRLLRERAWPSEHIQWALIRPVGLYHDLLALYLEDPDPKQLGQVFNRALERWASEVPLSDIWAALPLRRLRSELRFCDRALLQAPSSKARFRERLRARFPGITALASLLDAEPQTVTGAT